MAYIGGMYYVRSWTKSGKVFDRDFSTEQEARAFGNEQWKLPFILKVSIVKMGYYKKKRNSIRIAEAEKAGFKEMINGGTGK